MARTANEIPQGHFYLKGDINKKGEQAIYLRYFCKGKYIKKTTGINIKATDWDEVRQCVRPKHPTAKRINAKLMTLKQDIDSQILEIKGIITPDAITAILSGKASDEEPKPEIIYFVDYANDVNELLYTQNKYGYSVYYNAKLDIIKFEKYLSNVLGLRPLTINDITLKIIQEYAAYRKNVVGCKSLEGINKSLIPLTRAIKSAMENCLLPMEKATPIINGALLETQTRTYNPEQEGEERVRYLTPEQLEAFMAYTPKNVFASATRDIMDIFLFSFYSCGLRISDLVTLEWSQIEGNKINKMQVKTKKKAKVTPIIAPEGMDILEKWRAKNLNNRFVFALLPSDYVFDESKEGQKDMKTRINSATRTINQSLRKIGQNLGFPFPLSIHVARHTFCVTALSKGVSLHIVSQIMGHSSILSTEKTYAEFLDESVTQEMEKIQSIYSK